MDIMVLIDPEAFRVISIRRRATYLDLSAKDPAELCQL